MDELLRRLGLTHTSMTVGDVVANESGRYFECLLFARQEME